MLSVCYVTDERPEIGETLRGAARWVTLFVVFPMDLLMTYFTWLCLGFAQVMLKESVYLAISTYGTLSVLGGIASMLLPIETKGRAMMVSSGLFSMVNAGCFKCPKQHGQLLCIQCLFVHFFRKGANNTLFGGLRRVPV